MKTISKSIVMLVFAFFLILTNVKAAESNCMGVFSDMDSENIFCPYAEFLYHQAILNGDKNDGYKFKSDDNLTRGQLAKIIKTGFQIPTNTSKEDFPDVDKTNSFYTEIKSLKNAGIISGNSKGLYEPNAFVTRGAMMKFITNAARFQSPQNIPKSTLDLSKIFPDVPTNHTFYSETRDVYALSKSMTNTDLKIINGYSDGNFYPNKNVTRGQAAKIITNSMKLIGIELVECSQTFCQDMFKGPIVPNKNIYNDGNIKITFPDTWSKSETLTKFLFAYEFNSGVQSIVGEKTSLNYVLELTTTRCEDLGKEIQSQLSGQSTTFDEVILENTELVEVSNDTVCKVELKNLRNNIHILQNIYILVINSNEVYQIVSTSGSESAVDEEIIKTLEVLV
ncbi:S-layer homology domain-containing protein [Candidatus Dojkabacteria bacterium]|nr:S-layer homology domain-containing protein [Candidatus Dojkabacteria bacterium]